MKERPILFSAPMVRAILGGNKTQTRRIVKPRKDRDMGCDLAPCELAGEVNGGEYRNAYCEPGDRLWVREAFAGSIAYERHGYPLKEWGNKLWYIADGEPRSGQWTRPRPSIHMPRCLSRITLEVTAVRVERLHDISEADAVAEGITYHDRMQGFHTEEGRHFHCTDPRQSYAGLWEQINGPGSWDANTFVWVVEFRRVGDEIDRRAA